MYDAYKALYLHIPFCKQRCIYCDFETQALPHGDAAITAYIDSLIEEIRHAAKDGKLAEIETVYLGGGTPSYVGGKNLSALLYALSVSMHLTSDVECSMEANPESLTEALVKDVWALGVNRLSLGVQSFDDALLKKLGRVHSADDARRAIDTAQKRFDNVSIDLMCGIPEQTFEDFHESLKIALDLGVKHVSVYPLTVEEGTPLAKMQAKGEIEEVDQDFQALMMQMAASILEPAGLLRYEVASYALPGYECKHNLAYWTGKPYIGLGTSAVTMTQNASKRMRTQDGGVIDELDRRQMAAEDLMLAMRTTQGITEDELREVTLLLPDAPLVFRELAQKGFVERIDERYQPTLAGWLCGNEMYGKIIDMAP
ncbi:MAG: radical SAM family heme chaperone HemW [Eggerthellaceae bacterium]|jgi:oxygen-independent coproporphyrinogen-3 oxidase|nr:radical SAM family heme chaperone HemW [Eggerthellaceae bacterium]